MHFSRTPATALWLLLVLLAACAPGEAPEHAPAEAPEGIVGKPFGALDALRWEGGEAPSFAEAELTLVRWWTDRCPFCAESIPSLVALERELGGEGLALWLVHHPKPRRAVAGEEARAQARGFGFEGPLAIDPDWKKLEELVRRGAPKEVTSVSFLVDREDIVRWVHEGPSIHHPVADEVTPATLAMAELEEFARSWIRERSLR
jgi:hypothetical protein